MRVAARFIAHDALLPAHSKPPMLRQMRGFIRYFFVTMCGVLVLASVVGATAVVLKYGVEAESRGCQSRGGCQDWPFDSREWGTYGNLSTPVRSWMVDDLLNNVGVRARRRPGSTPTSAHQTATTN